MKKLLIILLMLPVWLFAQPYSPMYILAAQSASGGTTLKTGLISCWEFDETSGTTAYDSYGSNNGIISGALIAQSGFGNFVYSYSFDGINDYVDVGNIQTTNAMSASLWINANNATSYLYSKFMYSTNERSWSITMATSKIRVLISDDGTYSSTSTVYYETTSTIPVSTWTMVSFTFDGTLKIYINGAEQGVTKIQDASITTIFQSNKNVAVGNRIYDSSSPFDGLIVQPILSGRALTSSELLDLYNSGNGLPFSSW